MQAYKVFTHDLRSPIQGGAPVWGGALPFNLPPVEVDDSGEDCGEGWNACPKLADALRIGGLWPDGRPSRVFVAKNPGSPTVERGDKVRAATWTITRELTESEIAAGVEKLSEMFFGEHANHMAASQMAWREALGRPLRDEALVEAGLKMALKTRGLNWRLKQFESKKALWDAWDTRDALDARSACVALTCEYASLMGWVNDPPEFLTAGIRDAYKHGLSIAIPIGPQELGWAMVP